MKRITIVALAIVAMVGCQKGSEDVPNASEAKAISFSSEIATRATGTSWQSGDAIGIMVTKDNDVLTGYKYNAKYNADISGGTTTCSFNPESIEHTLYYPSDSTNTIHFYAYYPYEQLLVRDDESYPIDVADQSAPEKIDFMEASTMKSYPMGYSRIEPNVALNFTRRMSKLSFEVLAGDGMELKDITAVTLKGFYTTADYNFVDNKFTNVATQADITTYKNGDVYSAIVIPSMDSEEVYTPTSHTIVFTTTTGELEWDITDVDLNAGEHRYYNVTVSRTLVVSGGNEIAEWDTEDGGELEVE